MSDKTLKEAHSRLDEHQRRLGEHDKEFKTVKESQKQDYHLQTEELKRIANRPPVWITILLSVLLFLLGKSNLF